MAFFTRQVILGALGRKKHSHKTKQLHASVLVLLSIGAVHSISMVITDDSKNVPVIVAEFAYSLFNAILFSVFCLLNEVRETWLITC